MTEQNAANNTNEEQNRDANSVEESEQSVASNDSNEQNKNNNSSSVQNEARTFNPKTFPELLWLLIATKQGWFGILVVSLMLVAAICGAAWLVTKIIPPENKIEIQSGIVSFTVTNGNTARTVLSLSPNGGDKTTAWVKTGIKVKKGDDIKITASGRINTAMRTIVTQAIRPGIDDPTWVGPNGLSESEQLVDFDLYDREKLKPDKGKTHYGFGMLLTAVKSPLEEEVETESILPFPQDENEPLEFTAEKDGELVMTVNDIWLYKDRKYVYVPDFEENIDYYTQLAEAEATFKEDPDSWSDDMKREKAEEQHQKRLDGWKNILENNNWNIWYDDNIGSFSVAIVVNSKTK